MGGSGAWSARLAHEGGTALLKVNWSLAGVDHNGLLIHDLTVGVGEGRQGQGDSLHLPLTHLSLMLLFQVLAPGRRRGKRSGCASCMALLLRWHLEAQQGQGLAMVTASQWLMA